MLYPLSYGGGRRSLAVGSIAPAGIGRRRVTQRGAYATDRVAKSPQ